MIEILKIKERSRCLCTPRSLGRSLQGSRPHPKCNNATYEGGQNERSKGNGSSRYLVPLPTAPKSDCSALPRLMFAAMFYSRYTMSPRPATHEALRLRCVGIASVARCAYPPGRLQQGPQRHAPHPTLHPHPTPHPGPLPPDDSQAATPSAVNINGQLQQLIA